MRENLPRFVIITFLAMLLSACGGGGGGGLASGGTETTEETVPTLTLSILDESGVATSEVNGNTPVTVRAVLVDGNGDAVVGQVIIFTTAVGTLSPATGNALTGAGGIAEITLSAGTVADAGVVSASASIDENTITSNQVGIESDGGETDTGSLTLVVTFALTTPDDSITVSRDNAGTGTVTVTDGDGDPVDQAIVQFATTAGE
ncbi:MAG TPA: Ig-like domain-containing protein, partial [Pseudomonadales bacterium]|nr:Ig-like domain-containing protein [Pseudomonadales bacterium]